MAHSQLCFLFLVPPRDINVIFLPEFLPGVLWWHHIQIKERGLKNASSWQRPQKEVILFLQFLQSLKLGNGYPESELGKHMHTRTRTHTPHLTTGIPYRKCLCGLLSFYWLHPLCQLRCFCMWFEENRIHIVLHREINWLVPFQI